MAKQRYTIVAHCYDKKGILVSCATNSYEKSHPIQKYFAERVGHPHRIYLHAEIAAILRAKEKQIHHIKIFRYGHNGEKLLAKPCKVCIEALKAYGIKEVSYSTNNGDVVTCLVDSLSTTNSQK